MFFEEQHICAPSGRTGVHFQRSRPQLVGVRGWQVGRDTFVVETIGFNDSSGSIPMGSRSEQSHLPSATGG